jgi:hypothetical protein
LLFPRRRTLADITATVLSDGRLDIAGSIYTTPSEAAKALTGKPTNGWWFFLVDKQAKRSLREVRREYLESFADEVELDDTDDGSDDEDDA